MDAGTKSVIGVYFDIMERVKYRSPPDSALDGGNQDGEGSENDSAAGDYSYMAE